MRFGVVESHAWLFSMDKLFLLPASKGKKNVLTAVNKMIQYSI